MNYADFEVHLWEESGHYYSEVMRSPSGQVSSKPQKLVLPALVGGSPEALRLHLENAILRAQRTSRGAVEEADLKRFGGELFDSLFPVGSESQELFHSQRQRYSELDATGGLRLMLRFDSPQLAQLPWEYVYDRRASPNGDFLCLNQISPVIRLVPGGGLQTEVPVHGPLKVLGLIADPRDGDRDPLDTERERRALDRQMQQLHDAGIVNFQWIPDDSVGALDEWMMREPWHVFHFIGHGGVETVQGNVEEGFVVLRDPEKNESTRLNAQRLTRILSANRALRLVVLNCCEGARSGARDPYSSPGATLVRAGIPACIAMQFPISDAAAIQFASNFYRGLTQNLSVERSLTYSRRQIDHGSSCEWGIPVLFSQPRSLKLFHMQNAVSEIPGPQGRKTDRKAAEDPAVRERKEAARKQLQQLFANTGAGRASLDSGPAHQG